MLGQAARKQPPSVQLQVSPEAWVGRRALFGLGLATRTWAVEDLAEELQRGPAAQPIGAALVRLAVAELAALVQRVQLQHRPSAQVIFPRASLPVTIQAAPEAPGSVVEQVAQSSTASLPEAARDCPFAEPKSCR